MMRFRVMKMCSRDLACVVGVGRGAMRERERDGGRDEQVTGTVGSKGLQHNFKKMTIVGLIDLDTCMYVHPPTCNNCPLRLREGR